jgi:riboflavin transporter FmnP
MSLIRVFSREFRLIKRSPARYAAYMGVFTALAVLFTFVLHIPIFPPVSFLKLDFADVTVVFAGVMFGPVSSVAVAAIKNLINLPIDIGETGGAGVVSNFICAAAFGLTVSFIYNAKSGRKSAARLIAAFVCGVFAEICISILSNKFIIIPVYITLWGDGARLYDNVGYYLGWVPLFNLVKFGLQAFMSAIVFRSLGLYMLRAGFDDEYDRQQAAAVSEWANAPNAPPDGIRYNPQTETVDAARDNPADTTGKEIVDARPENPDGQ